MLPWLYLCLAPILSEKILPLDGLSRVACSVAVMQSLHNDPRWKTEKKRFEETPLIGQAKSASLKSRSILCCSVDIIQQYLEGMIYCLVPLSPHWYSKSVEIDQPTYDGISWADILNLWEILGFPKKISSFLNLVFMLCQLFVKTNTVSKMKS